MRPLPVEPLVGMPPFVLGVAIIRGAPLPVVHAGLLLGAEGAQAAARFVTMKVGARRVVLAVAEVIGVRAVVAEREEDLPPLLRDAGADVVTAIGTLDADLLLVLDAARLVPDAAFAALEARGAKT